MPGVTLSRWTLSYFAVALAALMVAQVLMAAGFGFPAVPLQAAETLVVVHLVAIGWLSLLMLGALFQFVPVLTARPLHSDRLAGLALVGLVAGLLTLVGGFMHLAGAAVPDLPFFPAAGALLGNRLRVVDLQPWPNPVAGAATRPAGLLRRRRIGLPCRHRNAGGDLCLRPGRSH